MIKRFLPALLLVLGLAAPLHAQPRADSLEAQLQQEKGAARLPVLADLTEALSDVDPERALVYGREAVSLLTQGTEAAVARRVWYWKGRAHEAAAHYDSVLVQGERLRTWAERSGDRKGVADGLYLAGRGHQRLGAFEEAMTALEAALAGYEALGDQRGIGETLNTIGVIHSARGAYDEARAVFTRALAISEKRDDKRGVADALNNIGLTHAFQGNHDEALDFYGRALGLKEEMGDRQSLAKTISNVGIIHLYRGDYDEALVFFDRALALNEDGGDKNTIADALNNIGIVHGSRGDYEASLTAFTRALALEEERGNKPGIANALNNIGLNYNNRGDYDEALAFYHRALALQEELGDKQGIANALGNIGIVHKEQGDYEEALAFYRRSLVLKEEIGDTNGIARTLNNIGAVHAARGDYDAALPFFSRVLDIRKEQGDKEGIASVLGNIGEVYLRQGRLTDALAFTDDALALADSIGVLHLVRDAHERRVEIFEQQERFADALAAHKAFKAAHDSLFTTESASVMAEFQEQYRTKEQQQRIMMLEMDQEIQQLWVGGLAVGLLLLALIAFLIFNRYRLKHRAHAALTAAHGELQQTHGRLKTTQHQLVHAEKMASLGALTAGIAHEIKNPLNFINNFAQLGEELTQELREAHAADPDLKLADVLDVVTDLERSAATIGEHGRRADGIVQGMMAHANTGAGTRAPTEVNALVEEYVKLARHGLHARHPEASFEIARDYDPDAGEVALAPQEIGRVVLNLLGNACDAVQEQAAQTNGAFTPKVTLSTRRLDGQVEIRVSDNGPGIPAEQQAKIFEPFFTTKPTGQGNTGLGLSLAYDAVVLGHGGELAVESEEGAGATFIVTLPTHGAVEVAEG